MNPMGKRRKFKRNEENDHHPSVQLSQEESNEAKGDRSELLIRLEQKIDRQEKDLQAIAGRVEEIGNILTKLFAMLALDQYKSFWRAILQQEYAKQGFYIEPLSFIDDYVGEGKQFTNAAEKKLGVKALKHEISHYFRPELRKRFESLFVTTDSKLLNVDQILLYVFGWCCPNKSIPSDTSQLFQSFAVMTRASKLIESKQHTSRQFWAIYDSIYEDYNNDKIAEEEKKKSETYAERWLSDHKERYKARQQYEGQAAQHINEREHAGGAEVAAEQDL